MIENTSDDLCDRCMQPVPSDASRCPKCGTPYANSRRLTILVAAGLVLLAVLIAVVLVLVTRNSDTQQSPTERAFVPVRTTV